MEHFYEIILKLVSSEMSFKGLNICHEDILYPK